MGKRYVSLKGLENGERIYKTYQRMKLRCYWKGYDSYENYGGRGIKVCDEWLDKETGFMTFYEWATKNGFYYEKQNGKYNGCTLDRIDTNGNYEPNNCRFVNRKVQNNNKRDNILYTINDKTQSLRAWCVDYEKPYMAVYLRIKRRGWDYMKALTEPLSENRGGNRK